MELLDSFETKIDYITKFTEKYEKYLSLIEKYKDFILLILDIKERFEEKIPKDNKFAIKLNIKESNICEYYIFDELSDFEKNVKIYQDKNILTNKDYSALEMLLDDYIKKINKKEISRNEIEDFQKDEDKSKIIKKEEIKIYDEKNYDKNKSKEVKDIKGNNNIIMEIENENNNSKNNQQKNNKKIVNKEKELKKLKYYEEITESKKVFDKCINEIKLKKENQYEEK